MIQPALQVVGDGVRPKGAQARFRVLPLEHEGLEAQPIKDLLRAGQAQPDGMVLNLVAIQPIELNVHVVAEAAAFSAQLVWLERAPKFSVPQFTAQLPQG